MTRHDTRGLTPTLNSTRPSYQVLEKGSCPP